jgi:hypothetical protein
MLKCEHDKSWQVNLLGGRLDKWGKKNKKQNSSQTICVCVYIIQIN